MTRRCTLLGLFMKSLFLFPSSVTMSAACDRTSEYSQIVNSLSNSSVKRFPGRHTASQSPTLAQHANFTHEAKRVSQNLSRAFNKVEKLALLAKKQSLFDDRSPEIQELTYIIKQDIAGLSQQVVELQNLSRAHNSFTSSSQTTRHSQGVVKGLGTNLGKVKSQFETLLKSHWEVLKKQEERRGQFAGGPVLVTPSAPRQEKGNGLANGATVPSRLLKDELRAGASQDLSLLEEDGHTVIDMSLTGHPSQQQMTLLQDHTDAYLQSRAEAMSNIESTIQELGRIFAQVATMVREQEESVIRIDTNVESLQHNVEAGHSELLKYFQSVTSNRWLMAKVCGVVIIFFILFVVLFA